MAWTVIRREDRAVLACGDVEALALLTEEHPGRDGEIIPRAACPEAWAIADLLTIEEWRPATRTGRPRSARAGRG